MTGSSSLGPALAPRVKGPQASSCAGARSSLDSFSASCSGRGRASRRCLRPPLRLQLRSHAPERDPERRGGPGGARLGGREPREGASGSPRPPDPAGAWERAAGVRRLPGFAGPAAPTQSRARGTTKASETFKLPVALETNGRPWLL